MVDHRHVVAPWLAVRTHRDWWLAVGLPAAVLAVALMWPHLGWWSLGVAVAVYGCGYVAYERYQTTRRMTVQMAETLGRLAELGGAAAPGHSARSATIAVAVGRRVGLDDAQLATVAHATGAMHVGRVGYDRGARPRPGFDTETAAEWSAAILRRAPGLESAADAVAPVPSQADEAMASMRSVVHVAAAFDEATSSAGLPADDALVMASAGAPERSGQALQALGEIFGVVR